MSDAKWSARYKSQNGQVIDPDKLKSRDVQQGVNTSDNKGLNRELSFKAAQYSVDERIRSGRPDPKEVHAWLVEQLNNGMSLTNLRMMHEQRILNTNQKPQEKQEELPRYDSGLQASHKKLQGGHSQIIRAADLYQAPTMNYPEMTPLIEVY
jgi:hypothetical protein